MLTRYAALYKPEHPNSTTNGQVRTHVYNASKALGKAIPKCVEIHHIDGNKLNNRNDNLVVCQDKAYHLMMHRRKRALKACGNANHRKCPYCGEYDNVENMYVSNSEHAYHTPCKVNYNKELKNRPGKTKSQLRMEAHLATMERIAEMRKEGDSCSDNV